MVGLSGPEADGSIRNPNLSQPPICEWKPMVPPLFKSGRGEGSTQTILAGFSKKFHVKGSASSNGSGGDGGRPSPAFLLALTMALELITGHFNMIPENQKQ